MFGTVPPPTGLGKNTRSPDSRSIWPLTANGRSGVVSAGSEQAFPEHPFTLPVCHTP